MASSSPAKIKAYLASIKESIIDNENLGSKSIYIALIRLEILQRGIIVQDDDDSKLLEMVTHTAGKPLIEHELPNPLLSGSSAMAGRIAEKLYQSLVSLEDLNLSTSNDSSATLQSSLKRCQAVSDHRFHVLLSLCSENELLGVKTKILYIAEGYYYRAASFQLDAQPMWKKAWDVIVERRRLRDPSCGESSWEAVLALKNLRRIVAEKGNRKRAAELTLRLVDSLLDTCPPASMDNELLEAFIAPHRSISLLSAEDAAEQGGKELFGDSYLEKGETMSSQDEFLYHILAFRVLWFQEQAAILKEATAEHLQAKNRIKGLERVDSLDSFLSRARNRTLASTIDPTEIDVRAKNLMDFAFKKERGDDSSQYDKACSLLKSYLQRSLEKATAIALDQEKREVYEKMWMQILGTVDQLLSHFADYASFTDSEKPEVIFGNLSLDEKSLLEVSCLCAIRTYWMLLPIRHVVPFEHLNLVKTFLIAFTMTTKTAFHSEPSSELVKSKLNDYEKSMATYDAALISVRSLLIFSLKPSDVDATQCRDIVDKTISMAGKGDHISHYHVAAEYGSLFVGLLVAWFGFHKVAWQFCSVPEARILVRQAKSSIEKARDTFGRPISDVEKLLMSLAQADAEVMLASGGLASQASMMYEEVIERLSKVKEYTIPEDIASIAVAHCLIGLFRLRLHEMNQDSAEDMARKSLEILEAVSSVDSESFLYWKSSGSFNEALKFQTVCARQIVADIFIRQGKFSEANVVLEKAVMDAPSDSEAMFALGAHRLRMCIIFGQGSADLLKAAQIDLLKAAKLNPLKPEPFALLGYWFEHQGDQVRSIGCYSKTLILDPGNPIAGRGLMRLQPIEKLQSIIEKATESVSAFSGWAWHATGNKMAMVDANDSLAVVSFLKALRCLDIEFPESSSLSSFYADPKLHSFPSKIEHATVLAALGNSYRRLGRFTASIRSFHSAIEMAGTQVSSQLLCDCGYVEMELGLYDEAAKRFLSAIELTETKNSVAVYGRGMALLCMAKRNLLDGKIGFAFSLLNEAISILEASCKAQICILKLLGDCRSLAAYFPHTLFIENESDLGNNNTIKQVEYVRAGEMAYRSAEEAVCATTGSDSDALRACIVTDCGCNILLQAQMMSFGCGLGVAGELSPDVSNIFDRSAQEFKRAIGISPLHAPAWCGLGCAVARTDPLLSQHAFVRALEINSVLPESYANLSYLYTFHNAFTASETVSDMLTQTADSPMMWINRALIFERKASSICNQNEKEAEEMVQKASDAYRASLQVFKEPTALFGLSTSCRVGSTARDNIERKESLASLSEYLGDCQQNDLAALVISRIISMEHARNGYYETLKGSLEEDVRSFENIQANLQKTVIDLSPIRAILAHPYNTVDETSSKLRSPIHKVDLAADIAFNPQRGDLWVAYAKEMLQSANDPSKDIPKGLVCLKRAICILSKHRKGNTAKSLLGYDVQTDDYADALALQCYTSFLYSGANVAENERASLALDLQEALLLRPDNRYGRRIIKSIVT